MSILLTAQRMAGVLAGPASTLPVPGALPPPPDPGDSVSQAEIDEYIAYVDALIRDMNAYLVNNENPNANVATGSETSETPELPPGAVNLWPAWVKFRIEWEEERDDQRDDNWYVSRDDYDTIKSYHRRALEFKKSFEDSGVRFSPVKATTTVVTDPTGAPVIDPKTKQPVLQTTVSNQPGPIRGGVLPEAPREKDSGWSDVLPSRGTLILAAGAVGGFLLLREYIRSR